MGEANYLLWLDTHYPWLPAWQMCRARDESWARSTFAIPKDALREEIHIKEFKERPDTLLILATIASGWDGEPIVEKAVSHYVETDISKKPAARAAECFEFAFGRKYRRGEEMALADIVRRTGGSDATWEDEAVRSGDTEADAGEAGDLGAGPGGEAGADQERHVPEDERQPPVEVQ